MARPKVHANSAERNRIYKLRKRSRALESFAGMVLAQVYAARGLDVTKTLQLPWLPFAEVEKAAGVDIRSLLDLPFVEVDRSRTSDPQIRIGAVQRQKES